MRLAVAISALILVAGAALLATSSAFSRRTTSADAVPAVYLGFDSNNYPGDALLPVLKRAFSFAGYWLNSPPGGASVPWSGKRDTLSAAGFGFLVLFNGRLQHELRNPEKGAALGSVDARSAVAKAQREGFHPRTVIFVDQEEGGEMEPEQMAYLLAWIDGIIRSGFRAGIYCSGIPASAGKGQFVVTANYIREHSGKRDLEFFVYNDACPPSPGCTIGKNPPAPSESGVPFASVWQFAQSPRRRQYTASCSATYNRDGNCYLPGLRLGSPLLDLESATSADPSDGRR